MAETTLLPLPMPTSGDERGQAEGAGAPLSREFVDLKNFKNSARFAAHGAGGADVPLQLCAIEQHADALVIAVSDPSRLMVLDEIAGLLGTALWRAWQRYRR